MSKPTLADLLAAYAESAGGEEAAELAALARDPTISIGEEGVSRAIDLLLRESRAVAARDPKQRSTIPVYGSTCLAFPTCIGSGDRCSTCPVVGDGLHALVVRDQSLLSHAFEEESVLRCAFELEALGIDNETMLYEVDVDRGEAVRQAAPIGELVTDDTPPPLSSATLDTMIAAAFLDANAKARELGARVAARQAERVRPKLEMLTAKISDDARRRPDQVTDLTAVLSKQTELLLQRHEVTVKVRLASTLLITGQVDTPFLSVDGEDVRFDGSPISCRFCGESSSQLVVDELRHVVGFECADSCLACGRPECAECLDICRICGSLTCTGCRAICDSCGKWACRHDFDACGVDGHMKCAACLKTCQVDGVPVCRDHALDCAGGESICEAHVVTTKGTAACASHSTACDVCSDRSWNGELVHTVSERTVCRADSAHCAQCVEGVHALDEVARCAAGAEPLCGIHGTPCTGDDAVCVLHGFTCTICQQPTCQNHLSEGECEACRRLSPYPDPIWIDVTPTLGRRLDRGVATSRETIVDHALFGSRVISLTPDGRILGIRKTGLRALLG